MMYTGQTLPEQPSLFARIADETIIMDSDSQ
jgi:hypothetical protein